MLVSWSISFDFASMNVKVLVPQIVKKCKQIIASIKGIVTTADHQVCKLKIEIVR
jgi:hypothetical protein